MTNDYDVTIGDTPATSARRLSGGPIRQCHAPINWFCFGGGGLRDDLGRQNVCAVKNRFKVGISITLTWKRLNVKNVRNVVLLLRKSRHDDVVNAYVFKIYAQPTSYQIHMLI